MTSNFFDRLKKIFIGPDSFKLKETDNDSLTWSIDTTYHGALQTINLLLQKCDLSKRNPQIYLKIKGLLKEFTDITPLLCRYVKHLYIGSDRELLCLVKTSGEFPHCPTLTHLTMHGQQIDSSVSHTLRRAINSGKLPSLRRVTMIKCLDQGPRSDWPAEVEVTMTDDENEVKLLEMFKSDEIQSSDSNC